ncbi:Crp/Fnr family transcriptional regulator [Desulfovibrio sp. OttesenSCG-928-O18]|nr:Crp/Fnr family transcriptional regulator [Desulfovibrio sp. OttesenSCG-928-O18]
MALPTYPGPFIKSDRSPWAGHLHRGIKRSFKANVVLLHPEETCEFLYYVQEGEILTTHFASPEDSHKVNIIGENAVAGIFEMFSPVAPKASWRTLAPSVCYLFSKECVTNDLPKQLLLDLLTQSALMGVTMAGRFVQGTNKRNDIRLARFLLHFLEFCPTVKEEENGLTIMPNVTQELSGELLGMHPVTLNKLLAAYRKNGIIGKSKKSGLQILDVAALARYAEGSMPPLS